MPRSHRSLAGLALVALAPFLAGAHCNETCSAPTVQRASAPRLEAMLRGPAVLTLRRRVEPIAAALRSYEVRTLHLDVSRPAAVLLARSASDDLRAIANLDPTRLRPGDRAGGLPVIAMVRSVEKVALFADAASLAEAERAGWDTVVLIPQDTGGAGWGASATVEVGRTVGWKNDPADGRCIRDGKLPSPPEWSLVELSARCGDGVHQHGEGCDDGNRIAGDGCGPFCTKEE